jgi:hypothetical protein
MPAPTTGMKMIAGTDGWILEKKSRNRFSGGGEALSPEDRPVPSSLDFTGSDPGTVTAVCTVTAAPFPQRP